MSQFFLGGVILLIIGLGVLASVVEYRRRQQWMASVFTRLAGQWNGHADPPGWFDSARLTFRHAGAPFVLQSERNGRGGGEDVRYSFLLRAPWSDARLRAEIVREGVFHRVRQLIGVRDIEVGDSDFDARYVISANDAAAVRDLLRPAVRRALIDLQASMDQDVYWGIGGGAFEVRWVSSRHDYQHLESALRLGVTLWDVAAGLGDEGIEFVDERSSAQLSLKDAICQICGEPITTDAVWCRKCRTPHHHDCWTYYGGCSTYGCQHTKFVTARRRRRRE